MPTSQTWTGAGGTGDWGSAANWSIGLPGSLDSVTFSSGPAATLTPASGLVKIANLTMSSPNAQLTVQGSLSVGVSHLNGVNHFIDSSQGNLTIDGGSLTAGQYVSSATGTVHLTNGGTYLWQGTGPSTQVIDMGNSINDSFIFTQDFGGTIQNFQAGQTIAYSGLVNSVTVGNNTITFNVGAGTNYTINLTGNYDSSNIIVNGNTIQTTAVCFTSGTLIRTVRGDVPVESLQVGELAITASGEQKPIIWIGSRTLIFDRRNGESYPQAWPIKIQAGTFGIDLPYSDLWLSPGHAIGLNVIEDVFVPVGLLTNGATIRQMEVDRVTYWHIELEEHDALIANGLASESYLDRGNRKWFKGAGDAARPDQKIVKDVQDYGRPLIQNGPILAAIRSQLMQRIEKLGWARSNELDIHLVIDGVRVEAELDGNVAQFEIPAEASKVTLMSNTFAPADWSISGVGDHRQLGLDVHSFHLTGANIDQEISVADPRFVQGFYHVETAADGSDRRWSNGKLPLPSALWADNQAFSTVLRVRLMDTSHQCWIGSPEVTQPKVVLRTVA